jgi:MFS transporter, DHA1 family, multidrug resistance protein
MTRSTPPRSHSAGLLSRVSQRLPMVRDLPDEVAVLAAIAFCVALGFGIVAPAIPLFARSFGVTAFLAGAVVSAFAAVRFIASPGAGWFVNRVGERRVLATGLVIVASSSVAAAFAQTYWQLLVMRALGGFGSTMFTVSALALLLRIVPAEQRGRAAGVYQGGFLFGGVAGPLVGGAVIGFSIRAPFLIYAVTLALATYVALRWLPTPQSLPGQTSEVQSGEADGSRTDPHSEEPSQVSPLLLRTAMRSRAYWAALMSSLNGGFAIFGLRSALIPLFVVEGLRRGPGLIGVGLLVAAAVHAVLLLPAGRMSDTRGRRVPMIIGSAASVAGMLLLVLTPQLSWFFAAMVALGISAAFLGPAPAAVVGDVTHGRPGGAPVAAFQMASDFGAVIGPLIGGLLLDSAGFGPAFAFAAGLSAVALLFSIMMPETLRQQNLPA